MEEIKSLNNKIENKQPSNIEAEQALLGSVLVNNDIIDEVSTIISSSIFYDPAHVKIYEVIQNLNNMKICYFLQIPKLTLPVCNFSFVQFFNCFAT